MGKDFIRSDYIEKATEFVSDMERDYSQQYLESILKRIIKNGYNVYHEIEGLDDTTLFSYLSAKVALTYHKTGVLGYEK